jgi:PAS domain S-box-containing protein
MKKFEYFYRNLPIRFKLLLVCSSILVGVVLLAGIFIYGHIRNTIEANIESELTNSTTTILNMVQTSANTSIRNYMRAVAEKNKEIAENIYKKHRAGFMTEGEAKAKAQEIMLSQRIGKTGYIYCIDSKGFALMHPNPDVAGRIQLHNDFVREQTKLKEGYLEYEWQSPSENRKRQKALYMAYFEPWDWIISVSAYRDEFKRLVNVHDFRDSVLTLQFGKTGYSYILDSKGNVIIHPKLQGNVYDVTDAKGWYFVRDIVAQKQGKIIYAWKNPDEEAYRDKFVIFSYIPEYDWIVASTSYKEEFYAPLNTAKSAIFAAILGTILLGLPLIFWISASITQPLRALMNCFARGASGDLTVRMQIESTDEIGQLTEYFNDFMRKLELSYSNLQAEIDERKQTEEALRESEEKYRNILESIEEGYFEVDLDGNFTFLNDSMLKILKCSEKELSSMNIREFTSKQHLRKIINTFSKVIEPEYESSACDWVLMRRDHSICFVEASVSMMIDKRDQPLGFRGVLRDLTERKKSEAASKRLEQEILDISERERQRIGRELHDDLCPQLIGIEVLSKVLKQKLEKKQTPEANDAAKIETFIQDSINKTRRLSRGLQPVDFANHGFESSLVELAIHTKDVYGIACYFQCDIPRPLQGQTAVATHIYYIVREAVHNAVKHAEADNIFIIVTANNGNFILKIKDDGRGIPEKLSSHGMGLRIMNYRAKKVGAFLDVRKGDEGGTLVTLELKKDRLEYGL